MTGEVMEAKICGNPACDFLHALLFLKYLKILSVYFLWFSKSDVSSAEVKAVTSKNSLLNDNRFYLQ